jgi:hypothetical protein
MLTAGGFCATGFERTGGADVTGGTYVAEAGVDCAAPLRSGCTFSGGMSRPRMFVSGSGVGSCPGVNNAYTPS